MNKIIEYLITRETREGDAVMFDIDDTLINSKTGKVIPHIKTLLNTCKQIGYKIVIITARPGHCYSQRFTEKELAEHNITYDFLGFCDAILKTYLKQHLMKKEGWHFVMSVGDRETDLTDSDIYVLVQ